MNTFEEAVDYVAQNLDKNTANDPLFHFTGGMKLRNDLGLWDKNSELYKHMKERFGLSHADDTGSLIANAAHAKVNGKEYDPAPDVERFKAHWNNYGIDPETMEPLNKNTVDYVEKDKITRKFLSLYNKEENKEVEG